MPSRDAMMGGGGTVLVTGGSGYISRFCIARLLNDGWTVRTTLRDLAKAETVRKSVQEVTRNAATLQFTAADLNSDAGWADAMRDVDFVLHVASPLPSGAAGEDLLTPARDGTLRVLTAARDAGVHRTVVTSSNAAMSYGRGGRERPFDETDWSDISGSNDISDYEIAKTVAEQTAWAWHAEHGQPMELAVVNPTATLGPVLGNDFSLSLEIVRGLLEGAPAPLLPLGWPIVDARDLADLHVRAMLHPEAAGHRFVGGGDFYWLRDIARLLRTELPEHSGRVPVEELTLHADGSPDQDFPRAFELNKFRPVCADKAKSMLGWAPRSAPETILDAARSLIERHCV